jgi:hypothetical protein
MVIFVCMNDPSLNASLIIEHWQVQETRISIVMLYTGTLVLITVTKEVVSGGSSSREAHFTYKPGHNKADKVLYIFQNLSSEMSRS